MNTIQTILNSLIGQFFIGGITVASISALSNNLNNAILAGIVASIPIGMPSTIFVNDNQVKSYTWNLLVMTSVLVLATIVNYYLINHRKYNKYNAVLISLFIWAVLGAIYYIIKKGIF